jgi:hypothetical protein
MLGFEKEEASRDKIGEEEEEKQRRQRKVLVRVEFCYNFFHDSLFPFPVGL